MFSCFLKIFKIIIPPVAISTKKRRVLFAKIEKNKKIYLQPLPALIHLTPRRHFAISTKIRRFTGNTEGLINAPWHFDKSIEMNKQQRVGASRPIATPKILENLNIYYNPIE